MKNKFILLALLVVGTVHTHASILLQEEAIDLKSALNAVAKDMRVKLSDNLDEKSKSYKLTQSLSGNGLDILKRLSDVYDFDWYIFGGVLTVESGSPYINYVYRPKNIKSNLLISDLKEIFNQNSAKKIKLVEKGNAVLISGTTRFVNDVVGYSNMIDKSYFLDSFNNIEVARIEFNYISVIDRDIDTYDGKFKFPGAQSLISSAIVNIGQFTNVSDSDVSNKAYRLKLSESDKQSLEDEEKTAQVQALPSSNALLVRGTPDEIKLAKRIASLIDIQRRQLLFTLKVYDVSAEKSENFGIDSSWLNGTRGIYDIIVPPFAQTKDFLRNFQALSTNGLARGVYQTNLLVLENQKGHFGKKETATITLISERQVETQKIEADNSLYITGRLLPTGHVQAKIEYIEESLGDSDDSKPPRVSSQSLQTEVYIKPDQTVILGGFDNTATQFTTNAVPVLSSIPLLGELFKNTSQIKQKYKRYISISFEVLN
ncbi:type II secretion system protein GspD [Vibrio cholerae]|uniref:type II secretion system protein GspD n=1 Tax=Vibrio cholerae TaxID=666 RepID=UPI002D920A01|nr:secretin N-terminal domain-containing protein [Vibrio cholerae]MEB5517861.1 secretin [Vibrio cholerae]